MKSEIEILKLLAERGNTGLDTQFYDPACVHIIVDDAKARQLEDIGELVLSISRYRIWQRTEKTIN